MVGRLDDWLKVVAAKENITVDPGILDWAGVAVFKRAYQLFQERGYRLRLLSAAFRNHLHWSEFMGGEVVISPPCDWQKRFNASDVEVVSRIDKPVDPCILEELQSKFVDFRRSFEPDGMEVSEFDSYAPTIRTLRQFASGCHELASIIRDFMLPNPDA
jgi:transaldolase